MSPEQPSQRGLWGELLARFRDLSGAFDPFANDAHPEVRRLGREARARWPQSAADYFAIGDLCARLTPVDDGISETYAAKTIAAYARTATIDPAEAAHARSALLAFVTWVTDAALQINEYAAIKAGLLVCERVRAMNLTLTTSADGRRLQRVEQDLRDQMERIFESDQAHEQHSALAVVAERESRMLCDQGQMLLRQNQAAEALASFERSLQIDANNPAAWLWRAMALTDLGKFNEALASYDQALLLEPNNAGVHNSKGALLLELSKLEAALACFEQAIAISTAVSTVQAVYWLNKGKALYMLKRYPEALTALRESDRLDPSPESAAGIAASQDRLEFQAAA